ncbi:MAG: S-layer homology domain-containing protein [Dethiobacteria bacterium]
MAVTLLQKKKALSIFVLAAFALAMFFGSVPAAAANAALPDIEGHWAQNTLQAMVDEEMISGYPDGTFKPNNNITRAEFATLLVKAFALEPGAGTVFDDTAEHWAKEAIATANYHRLVSGYSESSFGPDDPVTREQIAVMIVNAADAEPMFTAQAFTDSDDVASWAQEAVEKAAAAKLIAGYPDGTFRPKANATRAEAAVVLDRGRKLSEDELFAVYDHAGTYGPKTGTETVAGDVIINAAGVILQNTVIAGDLIISERVGDGDVTLNNVTVRGTTFIRGGGKDSIHINGGQYNNVVIESTPSGNVRVVVRDAAGVEIVISEKAAGEEIILEGTFANVVIKADNVVLSTQGKTAINKITVEKNLTGTKVNLEKDTKVKEVVLDSVTTLNNAKGTVEKTSGDKKNESDIKNPPAPPPSGGGGGISIPSPEEAKAALANKVATKVSVFSMPSIAAFEFDKETKETVITIIDKYALIGSLSGTGAMGILAELPEIRGYTIGGTERKFYDEDGKRKTDAQIKDWVLGDALAALSKSGNHSLGDLDRNDFSAKVSGLVNGRIFTDTYKFRFVAGD